jgi:hypothetical protein
MEYRRAYRRLTGIGLRPGPPLPPLPAWVEARNDADVEALVRQVDRTSRRLDAA